MKISLDWLKDYVKLSPDITAEEIGNRLTLGTCEIEQVISASAHLQHIIVVQIMSCEPVNGSDHLHKVELKTCEDSDELTTLICGAPNARIGLKTAWAPAGTVLPEIGELKAKKIFGELSPGMICSEKEMGIGEDQSGIIELPENAKLGASIAKALGITPAITFDIDNKSLTNRPDLWGHYGLARELSALYRLPLTPPPLEKWEKTILEMTDKGSPVRVKAPSSKCLGFLGATLENVDLSAAQTPRFITDRLTSCGAALHSPAVDISNYVMLEYGLPNHIYDRSEVGDTVEAKELEGDQSVVTLDGEEHMLKAGDLVISSNGKPIAVAGIMGLEQSKTQEQSSALFIECAVFAPAPIRRLSSRLGIRTDASIRFEKSLDLTLTRTAMLRIITLIKEISPSATLAGDIQQSDQWELPKPIQIRTSAKRLSSLLSCSVTERKIKEILLPLGFKCEAEGKELQVSVPSWRATKDISIEADIVEELGRMIGYNSIEPQETLFPLHAHPLSREKHVKRSIEDFLSLNALAYEVRTYPLIGERDLALTKMEALLDEHLCLVNSLSPKTRIMRPSLLPQMVQTLSLNMRFAEKVRFFEIGRSYGYDSENKKYIETEQLCIGFGGKTDAFLDLRSAIERLLEYVGLSHIELSKTELSSRYIPEKWSLRHPAEQLDITASGKLVGSLTALHPYELHALKIAGAGAVAVLGLKELVSLFRPNRLQGSEHSLPKAPQSTFDFTITARAEVTMQSILAPLKKLALENTEVLQPGYLSIFREAGQPVKSITLRVTLGDGRKTLTKEHLSELENIVTKTMEEAGLPLKAGNSTTES